MKESQVLQRAVADRTGYLSKTPIFGTYPVRALDAATSADVHQLVSAGWPVPADPHPAVVYLARLSPSSRRTMGQALRLIAGFFGQSPGTLNWAALRYQHCTAVRTKLMETRSPATANRVLAALRGVLTEAWRLGLLDADAFRNATDLQPVRGERLLRGRALSRRDLQKLFLVCFRDGSAIARRDAALIAVLYGGGLRRSEAVGLNLADYRPEKSVLVVRHGKGGKERAAFVTEGAKRALADWLVARGREPGPLFWPADGRGRPLRNRPMTPHAVALMLRRRASAARVERFTPHDLRRTFVSDLLDAGADMVTVQKLAGHANVETTARYDRRGEDAQRRAAELLCVPFVDPEVAREGGR